MKTQVYCIYDKLAEASGNLFCCKTDKLAIRMFNKELRKMAAEDFTINPSDYVLVRLAVYENEAVRDDAHLPEYPYLDNCLPQPVADGIDYNHDVMSDKELDKAMFPHDDIKEAN